MTLAEVTPISEIMTRGAVCVDSEMLADDVVKLFLDQGISGAPVVDERGHAIGVVSKTDLLRGRYEGDEGAERLDRSERLERPERRGSTARGAGAQLAGPPAPPVPRARLTVGDIMTPVAFTMKETQPVSQAAALMAFEGIHRLPIVSDSGEVIGILSSTDVLRWIAQSEGYLIRPRE